MRFKGYKGVIRRVEHVHPSKLGFEQIDKIKSEYNKLTPFERLFLKIKFYTRCTSSYDAHAGEFMMDSRNRPTLGAIICRWKCKYIINI